MIVGLRPDNDFDEEPDGERFRPYWQGDYPSYALRYSPARVEDSKRHPSRFRGEITAHDVLGSIRQEPVRYADDPHRERGRLRFHDMMPLMAKAYAERERELYLECDGHWSPAGHDFAAKTLLARLYPSSTGERPP